MTIMRNPINPENKLSSFSIINHAKMFIGIIAAVPIALNSSAKALEVQVLPKNPQLGDTISVVIEANTSEKISSPTVTVGEKIYPAFEIAPRKYRSFVPTTPLEQAGVRTIKVSENGQEQNLSVKVRDRKFPVQRITLPPGKAGVNATKYELKRVKELKALQTPEKYWNGAFLTPNAGRTSTKYGVRRYYNGKFAKDYYHRGQDYAGAEGSTVITPAAGRVALVGKVSQGFRVHGNLVGIDHGQGVISIFMHLSRIDVKEGDFVQAGQKIGAVGSTGASTGPHLHWGLYVNGQSVDPLPWKSQKID
jgi:murein DD-endopeptidase MepM/ murein hydrolase activator NlpD